MEVIFTSGAGLDVHKQRITACRVTPDPTGQQADGLLGWRAFGTLPVDLLALSDGLAEAGITPVAMESTGEDGQPVSNILAGDFTIFLAHAAHVKPVPGRKTDQADARWLATLRRDGLLRASLIPPVGQRDRRDLPRDRTKLVQERGREGNRVHGVLARADIKPGAVATNMFGVSGRAMLAALIEGRADPATLAEWAQGRRRSQIPLWEQALTGLVRDHHRRVRTIQLAPRDCLDEPIEALRAEMARGVTALRGGEPPAAPTKPAQLAPSTPAEPPGPLTFAQAVTLLETMPGGDQRGAELVVAEWGTAMARVGTAERLSAWSGVAPGHDESAGKRRAGATRQGHRALRAGLTPWAHAAVRPTGT